MAVGLLVGPSGLGLFSHEALADAQVLVDVALGLILFKLGATLHPVALLRDRPLLVTSLAEGLLTFATVLGLMLWIQAPAMIAVLAAVIAVSSSPAVLIHVAEELHAKGPVLERTKALVASNNLLSFLLFTMALPLAMLGQHADLATALVLPPYRTPGAVALACVVARAATWVAGLTRPDEEHLRFALVIGAVTLTLGLAKSLQVSSLFAGLALGIACRWMEGRSALSRVELGGRWRCVLRDAVRLCGCQSAPARDDPPGALGPGLRRRAHAGQGGAVYGCQRAFGAARPAAAAGGLLLVPMAGLAIGLVNTTTHLMPELGPQVAAIVMAAVAIFDTMGRPSRPMPCGYRVKRPGDRGRQAGTMRLYRTTFSQVSTSHLARVHHCS